MDVALIPPLVILAKAPEAGAVVEGEAVEEAVAPCVECVVVVEEGGEVSADPGCVSTVE